MNHNISIVIVNYKLKLTVVYLYTVHCKGCNIKLMMFFLIISHRPIDIQTTDAGPGVSTNEKMSQLRLAECFMINGLDLQARFHYAPGNKSCGILKFCNIKNEILTCGI